MAAEYSRDLGDRTFRRQKKVAETGFWAGSTPGYGFRRVLLDVNGNEKGRMRFSERKCLASDRVKIVLGPATEVECVREIYQMVIDGQGNIGPTHRATTQRTRDETIW